MEYPHQVLNWVGGSEIDPVEGGFFSKLNPVDGNEICKVARSQKNDVCRAVETAVAAQIDWAALSPVHRGQVLLSVAQKLLQEKETVARIVALETGKSYREALGETEGSAQLGVFFSGEGQRLYARTTTSGQADRMAMTIRQPVGVAGLIIAANTPIANVAWKVFPALICGNAAVLKAAEDTPLTAWIFGKIAHEAGLPQGVLNVIQGFGMEAGAPLVEHPAVDVISFTGSTSVGREIAVKAGNRLAKVSLELGGKNPLVVCDDADLENAVKWTVLSAFSNAGQRCAAAGRIIVFEEVYERFREMLLARMAALKVGPGDGDDFGPVINERQLLKMIDALTAVQARGAKVAAGGKRLEDEAHARGFYMAPTLIEDVTPDDEISRTELFGPITCLYRASGFSQALELANRSPYGLTASIHTRNLNRALEFVRKVQSGVATVNAGTYGSEPHMPFGGVKDSGNGTREPGTEALDIYSELKDVYLNIDPNAL